MKHNFMDIVSKASANKDKFDSSVEEIVDALDTSVKVAANRTWATQRQHTPIQTTGWLRGALSYPWVVVCVVLPVIFELAM